MKGKDVINFIQNNHLEDSMITVTVTRYYDGDHDCRTTDEISISRGSKYIGKGKSVSTIDFYIGSSL